MSLAERDKMLRDGEPLGFRTMPIQDRIKWALQRIRDGRSYMRIPADQTDPDIVLADCLTLLTSPVPEGEPTEAMLDAGIDAFMAAIKAHANAVGRAPQSVALKAAYKAMLTAAGSKD